MCVFAPAPPTEVRIVFILISVVRNTDVLSVLGGSNETLLSLMDLRRKNFERVTESVI